MKSKSAKKKNYFAVKITIPPNFSDPISNFLTELGSAGVIFKEEKQIAHLLKNNEFTVLRILKKKGWISVAARKTAHN